MFNLDWLLESARWQKKSLSIGVDFVGLLLIPICAIWLRLGSAEFILIEYMMAILLLPLLAIPIFIWLGLYRVIVRYIGLRFIFVVLSSVSLTFLLWSISIFLFDFSFPRSALIIAWFMAILYVSGSRLIVRWLLTTLNDPQHCSIPVVIYGAGTSGQQLMQAMTSASGRKVVAFIDDDAQLRSQKIGALKIYSSQELPSLINHFEVSEVLLAIPSLLTKQRKHILSFLEALPIKVSTLPSMDKIIDGSVSFSDIRNVQIEDLLGRDTVTADGGLLTKLIQGKAVLVSGAGGSIGSEICRQVIKQQPSLLILFELSEYALYQMDKELQGGNVKVISIMGSILDEKKLEQVINIYNVNTIYHAAAYKHVPLVEHNIAEGIRNNSFGTMNIARVAAKNKVANFVLISTDKAVQPTNFMGASKRLAEMSLQALQEEFTHTTFAMVRFGNVLGSSGSVIPLFKKQIAEGGPVTVTHKEITRYFMTIAEAASLVIQAGSMAIGGDVFVLDIGEPVKIAELAQKVIHLSGLKVVDHNGNGDIDILFTGLRPGEKLYEELLIGDNADGTEHPRIMKAHEEFIPYDKLVKDFKIISDLLDQHSYDAVSKRLEVLVFGFKHTSGIVDYLAK